MKKLQKIDKRYEKVYKTTKKKILCFRKNLLKGSVQDNFKLVLDSSLWTKMKVNIVCEINFSEFWSIAP